jgi:hypothetical protein
MVGVRNNLQVEFYGDFSHLCFADRKKFSLVAKVSAVDATSTTRQESCASSARRRYS